MSVATTFAPSVVLSTGATMPVVALGTWRSPTGQVEAAVYEAIRVGYRHIDCARVYGNEAEVGRGIARAIAEGLVKREELFVTSKVWNNSHAVINAKLGLEASLKDLQLSYLDLLLIHWPVNFKYVEGSMFPANPAGGILQEEDPSVASIKTCYQAMETFVDAGLVRSIGVSNFSEAEIDDVLSYARIKPAAHQIEIHPFLQQDALIAYGKKRNIVTQAYSPLGNLLAAGEEDVTPLNDERVLAIAKKHNKSPAQVILRWGLAHSGVVLPKSVTASRIAENLALFDFTLDDEDLAQFKQVGLKNKRFVNPAFRPNGAKVFA